MHPMQKECQFKSTINQHDTNVKNVELKRKKYSFYVFILMAQPT